MSDKTFSYKGYSGSIDFDLDESTLVGQILFVNDVRKYVGKTVRELRAGFEQAVDDYLDDCAKTGKAADKPFNGCFNVRLPPELHKSAALAAAARGQSLNDFVREWVAAGVAARS